MDLRGANLYHANLSAACLVATRLDGANLANADLSRATLAWNDLRHTDLRGANLRGATLFTGQMKGLDLRGADLRGARIAGTGSIWEQAGDLGGVIYDSHTLWPTGFNPQRQGAGLVK